MVALKSYNPIKLGFTPYQIATELAKPYDYDATLNEIMKWDAVNTQQDKNDVISMEAQRAKEAFDEQQKRDELIQSQLDQGADPAAIDLANIEKQLGNVDKYQSMLANRQGQESKARMGLTKDLASIAKSSPELAALVAQQNGMGEISGILQAPKQKGGEGDKAKPAKPEVWVNLLSQETKTVDANSVNDTNEAKAMGFVPADQFTDARPYLKRQAKTEPSDDDSSPGMLERFFNSGTPTPKASPMPTPPPGHLLVRDKKTGEVKIIKK